MAVNLTWTPPDAGTVDNYVITVTPGEWITVPGTQTSVAVTGLRNGTEYRFTVAARNATGTGPVSDSVAATPRTDQPGEVEALIVQYEPGVRPTTPTGDVTGESVVRDMDLKVGESIGFGLRTVELAQPVTEAAAERIADQLESSVTVRVAEPDLPVELSSTQESPPWGLDRIDQRDLPFNGRYTYNSGGLGVTAYIVDTGIRPTHVDFGGRVIPGYNTTGGPTSDWNDCHGHGTHVAGTVGGTTYGVAKNVTLVPVKVLNCRGMGTWSGVVTGLAWIVDHHKPGVPAVANMSLGGGATSLVDEAVRAVINDGVTVVVASGNSRDDACLYSPARERSAITVNASDSFDWRAGFSNHGSCTDIYAPGASVLSATHHTDTSSASWSGTSMAAPHVAGVAARILETQPTLSPQQVWERIASMATPRTFSSFPNDPRLLLFAGSETPPEGSLPGAPTNVTVSGGHLLAEVRWSPPASSGTAPIVGYRASAFTTPTGGTEAGGCTASSGMSTSCRINNLVAGQTYYIEVRASNTFGSSAPSAPRVAYTVTRVTPSAPTNVTATVNGPQLTISWQRPSIDGESPITSYMAALYPNPTGGSPQFTCTAAAPATTCAITLPDTSARVMHIEVLAINATAGSGSPSSPRLRVEVTGAPGAPQAVVATPSATSIRVAWQPPQWSTGRALTYDAQVFSSANGSSPVSSCRTTSTVCDVQSLTPATAYWVAVTAQSGTLRGPSSPRVPVTTLATVPGAPTHIVVRAADGALNVTWRQPSNGGSPILAYAVTARDLSAGTTASCRTNALSCQITGLLNGRPYSVSVVAENAMGVGPASSMVRATPATRSGPPTAVTVTPQGWSALAVTFARPVSDGGSGILSYRVRLFTSATSATPVSTCTASPGALNCRFTGLNAATAYFVDVVAVTSEGEGTPSERVGGTTASPTIPSSPHQVIPTATPEGRILVHWRSPLDTGGSPVTRVVVGAFNAPSGGTPIAQCETATTGTGGSCALTGVPVGTHLWLEAWAFNALGSSQWSGPRPSVTVAAAPSVPRDVTASAAGQSITVRWQAPESIGGRPVTSYTVHAMEGSGRRIATCQSAFTSCMITSSSLRPGTTYSVVVLASNSIGTGPASAPVPVTVPQASPPGAPTNVTVSRSGAGSAVVSFTRGSDSGLVTTFSVRAFDAASGGRQMSSCFAGTSTSCRLSARVGSTIWVQVEASNAVGTSTSARVPYFVR